MKYQMSANLAIKEVGGEIFVLNKETSEINSFNGTGAFIWKRLQRGERLSDIAAALVAAFEVTDAKAEEDMKSFMDDLCTHKLLLCAEGIAGG